MLTTDHSGLDMTGSPEAARAYGEMVEHFLSHGKETPLALNRLFEADPESILGWCAKGFFSLLLGRGELIAVARDALSRAASACREHSGSMREALYVHALREGCEGRFTGAIERFETVLAQWPADSFAAKLSHAMRFMLGDARGMRASIDRVLEHVGLDHPHIGYLLGCRAFALEETGAYEEAEVIGRRALSRAPRDAWGLHAVSHVHEMTGRAQEGSEFLSANEHAITHCNNFAFHVVWHQALFQLELGQKEAALDLYDKRIRAEKTDDYRDIANAASLLTRLELDGVAVGRRWEELADIAERRICDRTLVFADLHYLLALTGAGRIGTACAFISTFLDGTSHHGDQHIVIRDVGTTIAEALTSHAIGEYDVAARELLSVRDEIYRVGGSHAQRDVFEQVLLDSLVRAGMSAEAKMLLTQRLSKRQHNNFAAVRLARLMNGQEPLSLRRMRS
ncbi:tetratricopeptide repeat protein [Methylovirgula sp. 4M-Z18]|uniref:tetratricopeptide repeat protein n=1 Tax=Methylovirgula sp. 4M-Z18 TaxID=2293567 RepID=UPI000E2E43C2|nr:tetratricopeptide repeat protein [Methylovirgula sp. 4M-Z18]RFB79639.1 tetratricopeptide repeat protein [Methylovirgula sp. 4M-Z18]